MVRWQNYDLQSPSKLSDLLWKILSSPQFRGMMFSKPFIRVYLLGLMMVCLNFRSRSTFRWVYFLFLLNQGILICRRPLKWYQVFGSWLLIFWSNKDSGMVEGILTENNPQSSLRCFHKEHRQGWKVEDSSVGSHRVILPDLVAFITALYLVTFCVIIWMCFKNVAPNSSYIYFPNEWKSNRIGKVGKVRLLGITFLQPCLVLIKKKSWHVIMDIKNYAFFSPEL